MRYLLIPYNRFADIELRELDLDDPTPLYMQLASVLTNGSSAPIMHCSGIERIPIGVWAVRRRFSNMVMVVDEDGGPKSLPMNHRASYIYGQPVHGTPIRGNAILIGEAVQRKIDEDGDSYMERDFADLPSAFSAERISRWVVTGDWLSLEPELDDPAPHPAGTAREASHG